MIVVLRDGDMGEEPGTGTSAGYRVIGRRRCNEVTSVKVV
jgi:hypothetical protein